MSCDHIKYRAIQNPKSHCVEIEVYRDISKDNNKVWVKTDHINEMSAQELKYLADYIYSLFRKKNSP